MQSFFLRCVVRARADVPCFPGRMEHKAPNGNHRQIFDNHNASAHATKSVSRYENENIRHHDNSHSISDVGLNHRLVFQHPRGRYAHPYFGNIRVPDDDTCIRTKISQKQIKPMARAPARSPDRTIRLFPLERLKALVLLSP